MDPIQFSPRRNPSLRPVVPALEALEARVVFNATGSTINAGAVSAFHERVAGQGEHIEKAKTPVLGTLSGQVTNSATGKQVQNVKVQLIDANGNVVQFVKTDRKGNYKFKITQDGAYVVREVVPKGKVQVTPTFTATMPTGSLSPGFSGASWYYYSGNIDPTKGIPVGPALWNTIAPAGNLPFESPINIQGPSIDLSQVLAIHYSNSVPTQEVNTGAQIQVQFPTSAPDTLTLAGQQYTLSQFHYHDPAENLVNGVTFPMEEHFVNVSASGAETVVGVFLQLGPHNSALDPILNAALNHLDNTPANTATPGSNVGTINFAGLLPTSMQGWFYQGSLTTPPLSQVVNWLVFSTPITLDPAQLVEYQKVANDNGYLPNARPVQPLDGRRLNEIDFDVNFQNQSISGLNFSVGPAVAVAATSTGSSANSSGHSAGGVHAAALPVLHGNSSSLAASAAAQNYTPVAGCNCPLCQMLRNAAWQQVTQSNIQSVVSRSLVSASPASTSAQL
ncbi:MAG: carbonic anhydrase [Chloroflexota bacterium]|nr:carbonic anhydrase [Chloroflexota bacterium]